MNKRVLIDRSGQRKMKVLRNFDQLEYFKKRKYVCGK